VHLPTNPEIVGSNFESHLSREFSGGTWIIPHSESESEFHQNHIDLAVWSTTKAIKALKQQQQQQQQ
jgi:hypothetical protein